MRDDDDEIARAERNLINFMNEVGESRFYDQISLFRSNMVGALNQTMVAHSGVAIEGVQAATTTRIMVVGGMGAAAVQ